MILNLNIGKGRPTETQLIDEHEIASIKTAIFDAEDQLFYIVCNKYYEKLGFFVLKINPFNPSEVSFYVKWKNKLDINDCTIAILRDKDSGLKELILSFKIIYINMYSLFAVDISVEDTDEAILFRHASF